MKKTLIILMILCLFLLAISFYGQASAQVTQRASTDELNNNVENIFISFEKTAESLNSTDFDTSRIYFWYMISNYSDYQDNLAKSGYVDDKYQILNEQLNDLIVATNRSIEDIESNYYNYEIMTIYEKRNNKESANLVYSDFVSTYLDFDNELTIIQPENDSLKKQADALNINTEELDKGRAQLNYYDEMVNQYFKSLFYSTDGTVGFERNYAKYNDYGLDSYKQIYNYLTSKGISISDTLASYILPKNRIATKLTIHANNLTAYYNDVITISGVLSYQNGTGIPNEKISMIFNNIDYVVNTNATGAYVFTLSLNGSINMNSYKISTSYDGKYAGDNFLMYCRSPELTIMLELQDVYMTINCPKLSFIVGDQVSLDGTLTALGGVPVAGANVSVFLEGQNSTTSYGNEMIIGNNYTGTDGHYRITFLIPDNIGQGNKKIYTAYTWPSTSLVHAINSSKVNISVIPMQPNFIFNRLPLIYFSDDIIGIKGRLITPNGNDISGQQVYANLQGVNFDVDTTNNDGIFILSKMVDTKDRPGLQTLSLQVQGNNGSILGSYATVCTIIVLPYNRTIFMLLVTVTILSLIAIAMIAVSISNRKPRKKP